MDVYSNQHTHTITTLDYLIPILFFALNYYAHICLFFSRLGFAEKCVICCSRFMAIFSRSFVTNEFFRDLFLRAKRFVEN